MNNSTIFTFSFAIISLRKRERERCFTCTFSVFFLSLECLFVAFATSLTLNATIATKVVCFSRLLKCLSSLYVKQCGSRTGSTLFASILNLSVMLGNFLQQTTSADNIFKCIFFSWRFKGYVSEFGISWSYSLAFECVRLFQIHLKV